MPAPARLPSPAPHDPRLCAARSSVPIEVMVNSNRSAKWDFGGRVHHRPADDQRHARPHRRAARQGDRPRRARPGAAAAATRRRCASSSASTASSPRMAITRRRAARAMPRSPAPTRETGRPLPPLTLAELMGNRAAGLPLRVRGILRPADADAAAGRRHGPDRPRALRAGAPRGAAEQPDHRDPPAAARASGSSTGRAAGRSTPIIASAPCR